MDRKTELLLKYCFIGFESAIGTIILAYSLIDKDYGMRLVCAIACFGGAFLTFITTLIFMRAKNATTSTVVGALDYITIGALLVFATFVYKIYDFEFIAGGIILIIVGLMMVVMVFKPSKPDMPEIDLDDNEEQAE